MAKEDKPRSGSTKQEAQTNKAEDAAPQEEATVEFPATEDPKVDTEHNKPGKKEGR